MLHSDIDEERPIFYVGEGTGSHAFVCDGYNSDSYYHFNYGWGGSCDGWYLISSITPELNDFSYSQMAIVGIVPDTSSANIILAQTGQLIFDNISSSIDLMNIYGGNIYDFQAGAIVNSSCTFTLADTSKQIVLDIITLDEYLTIDIYESEYSNNPILQIAHNDAGDGYNQIVLPYYTVNLRFWRHVTGNTNDIFHLKISEESACPMISNVTSSVDTTSVSLSWVENGTANQWEVEYGEKGHTVGTGTMALVDSTRITIKNLPPFNSYEAYIKPLCGESWFGPISFMTEAPLWTDVVNEQPSGYLSVDNKIYISSAEALAWWAKMTNNGNDTDKDVYITSDINLYGRKWSPVEIYYGNINGGGHIIKNMSIYEPTRSAAFIRFMFGNIADLGFDSSFVKGYQPVATIATSFGTGTMKNCYSSNGRIEGQEVGVLVSNSQGSNIINCYSNNVFWDGAGYNSGIVGNATGTYIKNCYSFSTGRACPLCVNAGVIGYAQNVEVSNCYSIDQPYNEGRPNVVVGVVFLKSHIQDTSVVDIYENGISLRNNVFFDSLETDNLLEALNMCVESIGDTTLRTWVMDSASNNPIFGNYLDSQCAYVENVSLANIEINGRPVVKMKWESEADSFVVKCLLENKADSILYISSSSDSVVIDNLTLGETYYFYVKALCNTPGLSAWGYPIKYTF